VLLVSVTRSILTKPGERDASYPHDRVIAMISEIIES
jgi:hypothetical protein